MKPLKINKGTSLANNKTNPKRKIDWLKEALITSKTELPPIEPSITIDGRWMCTKGDLMLISGEKKAGKSNIIVNMLATAFMQKVDPDKTLKIRTVPIPKDKLIIYVDTEQSPQQTKDFIGRLKFIAGLKEDPENLQMFNLRKYSSTEKMDFLNEYLANLPKNVGLLVLDGVVDFLDSVNNEEMSKNLVDTIFGMMDGQMSVISVIHQGKSGTGAKGHAGEIFGQKCVGAISVSKDRKKQVHSMKCNLIRVGGDFPEILFEWDTDTDQGFRLCDSSRLTDLQKSEYDKKHEAIRICIDKIFDGKKLIDRHEVIDGFLKHDETISKDIKTASRKKAASRRLEDALVSAYIKVKNGKFSINKPIPIEQ